MDRNPSLSKLGLHSRVRLISIASALLALLSWTNAAAAHRTASSTLAAGPYGELRGVLKKTMFGIEVAQVAIRVDNQTQRKLAALVAGHEPSGALTDQAVRTVLSTDAALITAELRRDVPFRQYTESAYGDLARAQRAGLISGQAYQSLARLLPAWFRALQAHGARKGDVFECRVGRDAMRVRYRTAQGSVLADRVVPGYGAGRAVLASYVAPGSTFRKQLMASLFR